jgi:hypothetical protein
MKTRRPVARALPAILLLAISAFGGTQNCWALPHADLDALATAMAERIQASCAGNKPATGKHIVAVLKFTDKNYKYDSNTMGNLGYVAASLLQDKLKAELSKGATAGKFEVLDQSSIDLLFSVNSTSKLGVFTPNIGNTRKICKGVGIDVVVASRFLFDDIRDVQKSLTYDDVRVEASAIFPSADEAFSTSVRPDDVLLHSSVGAIPPNTPGGGTPPNQITPNKNGDPRLFDVEFFLRVNLGNKNDSDPNVWQPMPLKVAVNPNSAGYGTFFLELDEAKHKNKRFKIRLKYKGPRSAVTDRLARERIYAAALTIDGLDSFYHPGGSKLRPKFVHAQKAMKWVLTPPGFIITASPQRNMPYPAPYAWGAKVGLGTSAADPRHKGLGLRDSERIKNGRIQRVGGLGHSSVDVRGFQNGPKFAEAFVFKTGGTSLANLAGSVADVGEIKVYIYGEELPLPVGVTAAIQAGVGAGVKLSNPVLPIRLRLDQDPHEVWTIKYRYKNSKNPPPPGMRPVTGTFP